MEENLDQSKTDREIRQGALRTLSRKPDLQGQLANAAGTQGTMSAAVHRIVCACFLYRAGLICGAFL